MLLAMGWRLATRRMHGNTNCRRKYMELRWQGVLVTEFQKHQRDQNCRDLHGLIQWSIREKKGLKFKIWNKNRTIFYSITGIFGKENKCSGRIGVFVTDIQCTENSSEGIITSEHAKSLLQYYPIYGIRKRNSQNNQTTMVYLDFFSKIHAVFSEYCTIKLTKEDSPRRRRWSNANLTSKSGLESFVWYSRIYHKGDLLGIK